MQHVITERQDGIAILKMASGKANAIHAEMLAELSSAFQEVAASPRTRGVVLASDRPRFFSAGFDLHQVFQYTRPVMTDFFGRFIDLYELLLRYPKPLVAALSGHAVAGGAVLALTADQRVMTEGDYSFALNEVKIGVALPPGVLRMAVTTVGFRAAYETILTGDAIQPARAYEIGLVDELAPTENVLERALRRAQRLAAAPPQAFAETKRQLQQQAGFPDNGTDREALPKFLDLWFSPESVKAREALLQSMRG